MDPVRAAWVVMTAYIHVSHTRDTFVVKTLYHLRGVEAKEHVVMPCMAMGVHEDGGIGEVVVVVNDVAEVHLASCVSLQNGENVQSRTIASRPLFLGILFSASGLSTSYITSGASGISCAIQLMSSFSVFGITILNV